MLKSMNLKNGVLEGRDSSYFGPNVFFTQALVFSMSSLKRFSSSGVRFGGLGSSAGVA
jgi:hypothetical protein